MGTPAFALPALDLLNSSPHNIAAVVTQPDRLSGRGQVMRYSAVKKWAVSNCIETFQPQKMNEVPFLSWLDDLKPDLIVTVAFGRLGCFQNSFLKLRHWVVSTCMLRICRLIAGQPLFTGQ